MARILIIDDEDPIRDVMKDALEGAGHQVIEAPNGVAGLKAFSDTQPDLIVLDLNMPRMDGYMFMERLKERWENDLRRWKYPEILVLSAVERKNDVGLAENLGATRFMNKPLHMVELTDVVEELLTPKKH